MSSHQSSQLLQVDHLLGGVAASWDHCLPVSVLLGLGGTHKDSREKNGLSRVTNLFYCTTMKRRGKKNYLSRGSEDSIPTFHRSAAFHVLGTAIPSCFDGLGRKVWMVFVFDVFMFAVMVRVHIHHVRFGRSYPSPPSDHRSILYLRALQCPSLCCRLAIRCSLPHARTPHIIQSTWLCVHVQYAYSRHTSETKNNDNNLTKF